VNPLDDSRIRLSRLARELASTDLAKCEQVIRSMTNTDLRGPTGKGIAWTAARTDKALGRSLFDDAERLANSITGERGEKAALDLLYKWKTHRGL
jgi:hypothetical protein